MVKATVIHEFNSHFTNTQPQNQEPVCVFAGATSGIGAATLTSITSILRNPTLYILGRSVSRFAIQQEKLHSLNLDAKIVFLEVDVSLLSDVDKAYERIQRDEWKVDYLYMSAGLVPLNGAEYTKEGLEICFALPYYTRIRLISNLLPLLSITESARPKRSQRRERKTPNRKRPRPRN
ncbi:uncharacterized protein ASPGLDRAFT_1497323 [Aspergillus glaucus CBS 516.65]|uniref:Ketoreductase (KR) domain-containing protein n=1 Tax=Aspergillus glaucus CBS 516.65 TaxID=1160497 RepID=A0A1L9VDG2_ASPGL|nr:hypothetical protein ASPGLDRAFT_1497323 [Aspergillus glaucus CBS 516.65]OJJ81964.1 hypothetical protein ASPGLDRAFT_1497323 [Aspergillus glaucus CBS 516.65]